MFDPIDIAIGARVKRRRTIQGMSQKELGAKLGVTFQQVQKYEKGVNRIGAGRLYHIAHILDMSVAAFFDEISPAPKAVTHVLRESSPQPLNGLQSLYAHEAADLLNAFDKISDAKVRRQITDMAKSFAKFFQAHTS